MMKGVAQQLEAKVWGAHKHCAHHCFFMRL